MALAYDTQQSGSTQAETPNSPPLPGITLAAALAAVATVLGWFVPVVGAPVIAILGGILVSLVRRPAARYKPGIAFVSKHVLQGSIVVLGFGLSLGQVVSTGASSMPVLLGSLAAALGMAWLAGRLLRLPTDLKTLIGVGTAVCGASAIAATDAVIDADEADVSYAIATIFTFNIAAVLLYPSLGHALGLSQHSFGLWAGTAVNDLSSVVAASTIYGHTATSYAVIVKLTRTLAIIPICLTLAARRGRVGRAAGASGSDPAGVRASAGAVDARAGAGDLAACAGADVGAAARVGAADAGARAVDGAGPPPARRVDLRRILPLFIVAFVGAVLLNTAGLVPAGMHHSLSDWAAWMITAALGAIGLSTDLGHVRRAGLRPLALGAILWVTVGLASLGLQALTGTL